jgi:superfamily II DNA/RNA helicase
MSFSELGLSDKLLASIKDAGYVNPTAIQQQAIPFVLQGRDVMGCAQTGTGKTASFTLPMIEILAKGRARARMPRSLILEPTRELAAQVQENFATYGAQHKLTTCLIIGGESMTDQAKKLERGVDVLIATPGRLIDQMDRGKILLSDIKLLVIDECDRMLDMGFIPDIEKIVGRLPRTRQTLMFSATMPPEIRRLADAFLNDPHQITIAPQSSTAPQVEHAMVLTGGPKREALIQLLHAEQVKNAFIFCNRKRDIDLLAKFLVRAGYNARPMHGDMVQSMRQQTLEAFKQGEVSLLVCSDVAARGIDVEGVSHVFNFDVPHHPEDYVHRIGRTGRAGNTGKAFMIVTPDDQKSLAAIVKLIGKDIPLISLDSRGEGAPAAAQPQGTQTNSERPERPAREPRRRGGRNHPTHATTVPDEQPDIEPRQPHSRERFQQQRAPFEERQRPDHRQSRNHERPPRRDYRDDGPDVTVIGFGDDVPAFLKTASRLTRVGQ